MSISIVRQEMLDMTKNALNDIRVVVEGENFQPVSLTDYPFARFAVVPRETLFAQGTMREEAGLTSINLFFSRSTNTIDAALVIAENVLNEFSVLNIPLGSNNQLIIQRSWMEAVRHEDVCFCIPLFVRWINPSA